MARDAYSRKLDDPILSEHFLTQTLEFKKSDEDIKLLSDIEIELSKNDTYTVNDPSTWLPPHNRLDLRWSLRRAIANELFTLTRISDDDKIVPGKGGCKPKKDNLKSERQAYIVIGLPASGKSGISNRIAELTGAFILDNDYAKRKIPEFHSSKIGATITHEEADVIIFGKKNNPQAAIFTPLIFKCIELGNNIVIPKIGANPVEINDLITSLTRFCGYTVHIILVNLDRKDSTKRAFDRFKKTDRYVPLSLVFDGYANDPTLTYFRLKESNTDVSSFGEIDTTKRPNTKNGDENSIIHLI